MTDKMVQSNGVEIRTEAFGDPGGEPLLLIMGATSPGVQWPDALIQKFVDAGQFVIRYDNRDTGKSTCVNFEEHPYTLADMANDAVAVLDAYGLDTAHVAGTSMGGMITQVLILEHRSRLRTATIIMSSPGRETDDLEAPDPAWIERLTDLIKTPPRTREEHIERKVEQRRLTAGTAEEFDVDAKRKIATIEVDQAINLDAANNHILAVGISTPKDRRPLLAKADIPTLVIHGTQDPVVPFDHGKSLAETIPGAEFLTLEKGGHELPRCYWDDVVARMIVLQNRQHKNA